MFRYIRALLLLVMFTGVFIAGPLAQAQDLPAEDEKAKAFGLLAHKLDARLIPAVKASRAGATTDADAARDIKSVHGRALASTAKAELLAVRVDAPVTDALVAQIRATGAVVNHCAPQWNTVSIHATVSQIDALTKIGAIRNITLQAGRRVRQAGNCPNQADTVMNAAEARASYGVTGTGQTVGVISDSVYDTSAVCGTSISKSGTAPNITVTSSIPQKTGDLPASFQVVDAGPGEGTDEGEAMLELIHDVAPGAALAFASCDSTQPEMASNLLLLRTAAHCTVTADDIGFLDEPYFQDGPVAQAITTNYKAGVPHFSAFGNDASYGVLATYTPINSTTDDGQYNPPSGKCFHNWGISGSTPGFLPIFLPAGDELIVVLQWNQPFSSYSLGSGSQADLDLYLYASAKIAAIPLAYSFNMQGYSGSPKGDPVEYIDYTNNGPDTTVYLCINHYQGVRSNVMRLILEDYGGASGTYMSFPSGGVGGMTAYGHPTSTYCVGVGAMYWNSQSVNGDLEAESYSSQGGMGTAGIPYYFDTSGNALSGAPVLRSAPDLMAPDGCTTSVFDTGSGSIGGYQKFYGTSCAAPNAAAVAALVLQGASGTSLATIISTLKSTADKSTSPTSPNAFTGYGLIDANAALQALLTPPVITSASTAKGYVGSLFSYTITATGTAPITFSATNLPAGLTFSGSTIAGTPTAQGTFSVALSAVNSVGSDSMTLTVTIGSPIPATISAYAVTPNPASVGVTATFTATASGGAGQTLTYTWTYGDGSTGTGSTVTHAYSAMGTYTASLLVTERIGDPASATLTVTVTPPPVFASAPSAAPNPAGVGQTVSFSAVATEQNNPTLTYSWNFGDDGTATGASSTHAYTAAGTFTATLTVTDPYGGVLVGTVVVKVVTPLVGMGSESNGLGFSNSFDIAAGVDPSTSSPLGGAAVTADMLQTLTVQKLQIKLNLVRTWNDSISFSGFLPIPAGFSASGKTVTLDVSGVDAGFTLNAKGSSKQMILDVSGSSYTSNATGILGSSGVFTMRIKSQKGVVAAQTAQFSVKLTKGPFAATLASYGGLTNDTQKNTSVNIVVTILFNDVLYQTTQALKYTVRGATGMAK